MTSDWRSCLPHLDGTALSSCHSTIWPLLLFADRKMNSPAWRGDAPCLAGADEGAEHFAR